MTELLKALLTSDTAKLPSKAYPTDTGFDLFLDKDVALGPCPQACTTGVKLVIPEGYWVRFAEKSGKALKGLQIHSGVIDETYRGELKVIASYSWPPRAETNILTHDTYLNYDPLILKAGEAICQMILEKRHDAEVVQITEEELTETARGANGFGSTGR